VRSATDAPHPIHAWRGPNASTTRGDGRESDALPLHALRRREVDLEGLELARAPAPDRTGRSLWRACRRSSLHLVEAKPAAVLWDRDRADPGRRRARVTGNFSQALRSLVRAGVPASRQPERALTTALAPTSPGERSSDSHGLAYRGAVEERRREIIRHAARSRPIRISHFSKPSPLEQDDQQDDQQDEGDGPDSDVHGISFASRPG
jgi:hypothetical protein